MIQFCLFDILTAIEHIVVKGLCETCSISNIHGNQLNLRYLQ